MTSYWARRRLKSSGVSIVCWTVCSGSDQRKHQSSASLAFCEGNPLVTNGFPYKGSVTREMFLFDDVIMTVLKSLPYLPETNELICQYLFCAEYNKNDEPGLLMPFRQLNSLLNPAGGKLGSLQYWKSVRNKSIDHTLRNLVHLYKSWYVRLWWNFIRVTWLTYCGDLHKAPYTVTHLV